MVEPAREVDRPGARPGTLMAAALLVTGQAVAVLVFAVLEVVHTSAGNTGIALTTAVFFVVIGVGLLAFARGLARLESWARGPVVAGELIQLLTAYSFLGGDTTPVAVVLAVVALAVLTLVFHPASVRAMAAGDPR